MDMVALAEFGILVMVRGFRGLGFGSYVADEQEVSTKKIKK